MPVFTAIGGALISAGIAGAGASAFAVGATAAALTAISVGTTVGTSMYGAAQEKSQQKKLIASQEAQQNAAFAFQEKQVADAEAKAKGAEKLAAENAAELLKKKRLAQTNTILTSPLGLTGEANVGMSKLLGGGV